MPCSQEDDEDEDEDEPVGVDKTNQDRGCVVYPFNTDHKDALFMVLDGHGEQGDRVSEFTMRSVVNQLEMNINMQLSVEEALSNAFIHANTSLMTTPIKYMTSGSTCVAMYARGNEFWIANCGDSRVVMARCCPEDVGKDTPVADLELEAIDLSRDHKPDDPEEQKRIEEWGGFVKPAPEEGLSARVYLDQKFTMIGLAMARSIGDYAVKAVGVIPTPEIIKYNFQNEDKFTILASDGVWEFISSQVRALMFLKSKQWMYTYICACAFVSVLIFCFVIFCNCTDLKLSGSCGYREGKHSSGVHSGMSRADSNCGCAMG
jgi:protein phosphatase PTC2/3